MLSTTQNYKPIKQGWIQKKGGSGLLAIWRSKYLVLVPLPKGVVLWIYDDIDQTKLPKHELLVHDIKIDTQPQKYSRLSKSAVPFTIFCNSRKYHLAALTKSDFEEWVNVLSNTNQPENKVKRSTSYYSQPERPFSRQSRSTRRYDDDARSVYSVASQGNEEDDTMSVISASSRAMSCISLDRDADSTRSSNVDTLSFCSEPVLTPMELTLMGSENQNELLEDEKRNQYSKRRTPGQSMEQLNESWHEKFIEILNTRVTPFNQDVQMMELVGAFQETALYHTQNIIDDYHLIGRLDSSYSGIYRMNPDKSFVHDGIVFRFACDYDACSAAEVEQAMKETSTEMLAIDATIKAISSRRNESNGVRFNTVLMALLDYKGFRMIAHADTRQNRQMRPVHNLNPRNLLIDEYACEETNSIATILNLKSHTVQVNDDRRVRVPLSATVEIHKDLRDGDYYLTSLKDIFPIDHYNMGEIIRSNRLRPEFLAIYQSPLCSDALTPTSGGSRREIEVNDDELLKAARFLRENWIPAFVSSIDSLDICPYDSYSLTNEMHKKGINMRYLGLIYQLSTVPFVKSMTLVEMVARICKQIYRVRLRGAILHFRSVGATYIEEQTQSYANTLFELILGFNEKTRVFFETKIKPELQRHYNCGISYKDTIEYDFNSPEPLSKAKFESFNARIKTITGVERDTVCNPSQPAKEDERLSYVVAKHFKSLGPKSKLLPSNLSSAVLTLTASYYNSCNRFEEARLYAQAGTVSSKKNHALFGLSTAQLLYAIAGLQSSVMGGPDPSILDWYRKSMAAMVWHYGPHNLLTMTLHDRMSSIYHKAKDPQRAFEFHKASLETAEKSLGKNHAGCYLANLGHLDKSIEMFNQALNVFQSSRSDPSLLAEVHYHYADVLYQKGDFDGAVDFAQKCRRTRETCFGFSDIRVIHSCRQVAKMLLAPYVDYTGILTPEIKKCYREAIVCHEKVFRYLQSLQKGLSRRRSTKRGTIKNYSLPTSQNHSLEKTYIISGPLVSAPFGWTPPFGKNLMHKLTKDIVSMKLALVEAPRPKEIIRALRAKKSSPNTEDGIVFDADEAKLVIKKMASVTPSVYLDDLLQRVELGDECAIEELGLVIFLTESETVGLK
ncbi:hypothetical protein HK103_006499 [Boothiomyces macroporosus]|uniref:PH domain-containing protein n=1 Tax=Boothiomyces macroporosus TaxID=261099 RepID=A0AAD5UL88_9FUNG|nr:hypothetical protein HK103_006499 [Boothiomyces macroporosus]